MLNQKQTNSGNPNRFILLVVVQRCNSVLNSPEVSLEGDFVSYLSEGAGLLFTSERAVALMGAKYIFRLI
jgi:hypothetical protein